jgi:hypothetical protein
MNAPGLRTVGSTGMIPECTVLSAGHRRTDRRMRDTHPFEPPRIAAVRPCFSRSSLLHPRTEGLEALGHRSEGLLKAQPGR